MTSATLPEPTLLPLDQIKPYWRNPRRAPDEAVNALAESISKYGYQQPIVTDAEHTIIVGHTRYAALRRLGHSQAPVIVATDLTPEQVKQLRVIDNRTGEYTSWDFDKLTEELTALDTELARAFFPEVATPSSIEEADGGELPWEAEPNLVPSVQTVEFVCPSCFHGWKTEVSPEQIAAGRINP